MPFRAAVLVTLLAHAATASVLRRGATAGTMQPTDSSNSAVSSVDCSAPSQDPTEPIPKKVEFHLPESIAETFSNDKDTTYTFGGGRHKWMKGKSCKDLESSDDGRWKLICTRCTPEEKKDPELLVRCTSVEYMWLHCPHACECRTPTESATNKEEDNGAPRLGLRARGVHGRRQRRHSDQLGLRGRLPGRRRGRDMQRAVPPARRVLQGRPPAQDRRL